MSYRCTRQCFSKSVCYGVLTANAAPPVTVQHSCGTDHIPYSAPSIHMTHSCRNRKPVPPTACPSGNHQFILCIMCLFLFFLLFIPLSILPSRSICIWVCVFVCLHTYIQADVWKDKEQILTSVRLWIICYFIILYMA